ncbi:MAG: glutathione S-transferase family protein [Hyphomicrobium sp.]
MSLKFYYLSGSPFSWKVWLVLEHMQIPYELRILSADAGDLKSSEFLSVNPRGKAPAIIDRGFTLWESAAIVEYLAEAYPQSGQRLWPAAINQRATARRIAAEADGYVYPAVRKLVVELLMRRDGQPDPGAIAESKAALAKEFDRLEQQLPQKFLAGDEPSAADFSLYPLTAILLRVDANAPAYELASVLGANIRAWRGRVEQLPYFDKTIPPHWRKS